MVGQNETCKVTDFGMARDVQQENIYERKTKVIQKWGVLSYITFSIITLRNNSRGRTKERFVNIPGAVIYAIKTWADTKILKGKTK